MDEEAPRQKRSEVLAIENVRRIAEQLRAERNDALALAQESKLANLSIEMGVLDGDARVRGEQFY